MKELSSGTDWIGVLVFGTYLFQMIELVFLPVPSSLSTTKMVSKRFGTAGATAKENQSRGEDLSDVRMTLWGSVALSAFIISLLPAIVFIIPRFYAHLWPISISQFLAVRILSGSLLILGNVLTLSAVLTLRHHTAFQSIGEAERLVTGGLFGIIRNPIVVGLGVIFLGLMLAVPSFVMFSGFILFVLNQNFRIKREEKYLERRFGEEYLSYEATVGRYFPKIFSEKTSLGQRS